MLVPQTSFDDFNIDDLLDDAEQALTRLATALDIEALLLIAEELLYNAVQHSGEGGGTFALDVVGDHLVVKVEDRGVGIHATMSQNYPGISPDDALAQAFIGGGTSTGYQGRGGGLYLTLRYTGQEPGCLMSLFTGEIGYVGLNGKGKVLSSSGFFQQGVLVEISVPLP